MPHVPRRLSEPASPPVPKVEKSVKPVTRSVRPRRFGIKRISIFKFDRDPEKLFPEYAKYMET